MQSTEKQRRHEEYFRNLRRFAKWIKHWRETQQNQLRPPALCSYEIEILRRQWRE